MSDPKTTSRSPWAWVPSLYFAEGLPYVAVMTIAVVMYKSLGISNTDITFYTGWLYLPWVIKPLWSPIVDLLKTRRAWIWVMQLLIGGGLAGVALTIPAPQFFQYTLAFFWLLAFASATQDIAIDGFYLLSLSEGEQSFFSGIRNTFYRLSTICGQGLLVILVGVIQNNTGLPKIELQTTARPGAPLLESFPALPPPATSLEGDMRVVLEPPALEISPQPRTKTEAQAMIAAAKRNNVARGFTIVDSAQTASDSWWRRNVANPLGSFLRDRFGPETKATNNLSGNIGVVAVRLSKPPGREVVVNVASKIAFGVSGSGAKDFLVAEGARLAFNDANWNRPAFVVVQLDAKLAKPSATVLEIRSGNTLLAWHFAFALLAAMFLCVAVYHKFILPRPVADRAGTAGPPMQFVREFALTFVEFFKKEKIVVLLLFLFFYRFAEAQLVRLVGPFLLDAREAGGLGLTADQFGIAYGTVGVTALMCGGLLGGFVVSRRGLKFWLWWMVLAIHLPDAVFVYLAHAQPDNLWLISLGIAVEQFGYGFGFSAYMLYMIYIARGKHQTAHYAICTGFMALGMMIPGMFSGWLQEIIGYQHFFIWVMLATIPGFIVTALIPISADFGKKMKEN